MHGFARGMMWWRVEACTWLQLTQLWCGAWQGVESTHVEFEYPDAAVQGSRVQGGWGAPVTSALAGPGGGSELPKP